MKQIGTKWLRVYLKMATRESIWRTKMEKRLFHLRDVREAGYEEDFVRRIRWSGVLVPGGKKLSKNFVSRRDLQQAIEQAKLGRKQAEKRKRKAETRARKAAKMEKQ